MELDIRKELHEALDCRLKEMAKEGRKWGGVTMSRVYDDGKFIHIDIFSPNKEMALNDFMELVKELEEKEK